MGRRGKKGKKEPLQRGGGTMVERGAAAAVVDIMKERFLMIAAADRSRKSANPSFISTLSPASSVTRMI